MFGLATLALATLALAALGPAGAQEGEGPILALGGDVIFDGPILYAIDRFHDDAAAPALRELLSELAPALRSADLAVVNLECPVAPRTLVRDADHDAPTFAAPPALLDELAAAGVDAVTVANNHAYDQGVDGLASTLDHARRARLAAIGAGDDAEAAAGAVVLQARGRRVAFVAFSEGTNRRVRDRDPATPRIAMASESAIARSVRAARDDAALVVASLHWTSPLDGRPTRTMEGLSRAAAEAGADLVYAHGPHLPARRGVIATADGRRVPVLWSLGNLIAVMEENGDRVHAAAPSVRDAVIARVRTRAGEGGRLAIASIEAEPYWITTPQRAWWTSPTSAMVRPLSIRGELARLDAARCGRRCDRYAQSYRARQEMIASMFERVSADEGAVASADEGAMASGDEGAAGIAAQGPGRATPRDARRADAQRAETRRDAPRAEAPRVEPPIGPPERQRARRRAMEPARDVPPDLARGATLRIEFAHEGSTVTSHDRDQIRAIADLLLADRSLRVELVARAARDETGDALAIQRAHRARGLVAILGPSRARFSLHAGPPAERATITIRIVR